MKEVGCIIATMPKYGKVGCIIAMMPKYGKDTDFTRKKVKYQNRASLGLEAKGSWAGREIPWVIKKKK